MDTFFTVHRSTNCYQDHGALGFDYFRGLSSVECARKCLAISECGAFVLGWGGECFLRSTVTLGECAHGDAEFDTYVRRMPPSPPAHHAHEIHNSYDPGSDPDFRTCWLRMNHGDTGGDSDAGLDEHVYYDPHCSADMHGCGAHQHSKCRYCGFGEYANVRCPFPTKKVLLLGNSFLWSSTWHAGFNVPRMLKQLGPLFGYHPSINFNAFYGWRLCNHALCHNHDFRKHCAAAGHDVIMNNALVGGHWEEVVIQPQSMELFHHPGHRVCTMNKVYEYDRPRCGNTFDLNCGRWKRGTPHEPHATHATPCNPM